MGSSLSSIFTITVLGSKLGSLFIIVSFISSPRLSEVLRGKGAEGHELAVAVHQLQDVHSLPTNKHCKLFKKIPFNGVCSIQIAY